MALVGEFQGDTGSLVFERLLAAKWSLAGTIALPNWDNTTGAQFTCFTGTKLQILTYLCRIAKFTCFTGTKLQILTHLCRIGTTPQVRLLALLGKKYRY